MLERAERKGETVIDQRGEMIALRLTAVLAVLAAAAALTGLLYPVVYRETDWVVPQNRGLDLLTVMVAMLLLPIAAYGRRGSHRAVLLWSGLVGYVWYAYVGASFSYRFNELFLVYVACFSLSSASLIAILASLNAERVQRSFGEHVPRTAVCAFLVAMASLLAMLWLSQVLSFLRSGTLPALIVKAEAPTNFVFVLDLGVVVPVSILAAILLWRDRPWGYVLSGIMLVKAATMGLALLSMTAFAHSAGQPVEAGLAVLWLAIAMGGVAMSTWFLAACQSADRDKHGQ